MLNERPEFLRFAREKKPPPRMRTPTKADENASCSETLQAVLERSSASGARRMLTVTKAVRTSDGRTTEQTVSLPADNIATFTDGIEQVLRAILETYGDGAA